MGEGERKKHQSLVVRHIDTWMDGWIDRVLYRMRSRQRLVLPVAGGHLFLE